MEVVDPVDIARHERCSAVFGAEIKRGVTPEQILAGSKEAVLRAEERGNLQQVEDFLLIGTWAQAWIDNRNEAIEQGKQISNRMAKESGQRRAMKEVSLDVLQAMRERDGGKIRVKPSFDQLQERRYGRDWRKITGRDRGRDGL